MFISTCLISTCYRVVGSKVGLIRRGFKNLCCSAALLREGSRDPLDPSGSREAPSGGPAGWGGVPLKLLRIRNLRIF